MQINSIKEKLDFEVEAQDKCPDGNYRFSKKCSTDCAKTTWSGLTLWWTKQDEYFKESCSSTTTYSCSTLCKW